MQQISLTQQLNINNGSHILYFYSTPEGYLQNAVSYIKAGLELNQHVIFIDSEERIVHVRGMLQRELKEEQWAFIHFVNNYEFYRMYDDFRFEKILQNLSDMIQPYIEGQLEIRLWGHVDWRMQDSIQSKLNLYECKCDLTLAELGYLTVCAYDGSQVPASIQLDMMRCHEYMMTDHELIVSNLYRQGKQENRTLFPSLSVQAELQSEMDLYKQKLDFVHVVSHEVRNPLTVIKAYASLVQNKLEDSGDREKLKAICDYVDEIDNEITHIINTEQMLSADSFWRKKLILPYNLLLEVVQIMEVKGRTQNIKLHTDFQLTGRETIVANAIGFKLIVSNLLSNAIKYSNEGDHVTFEVKRSGGSLALVVEDHGIGMTEEQMKLLFRKYEKFNEERSGQGIGLFMVKKIVDHFGGKIDVKSKPGVGTCITVTLPIAN
ncbi:MEDS domain-containing protein [Paenibacillus hexagrammi]|uniref:histidine kinase n=1 Tax=Paenibacillus hexagrammi TaxID=2908839 RepID=A0ABY3SSE0_9BACL|nr:MEDS domain-containing protein [Paenibacillus sp. YPD9-1]UJF36485.1 MEDS domain-containing protein [Paenibacillus sp. YPD9-1]